MWRLFFLLCANHSPRELYEKMAILKQLQSPIIHSYYKMKILNENKHLFTKNDSSLFLDWNYTIE